MGNQLLECLREVVGELFGASSSCRTVVLQVKPLQAFHNLHNTRPPFLVHLEILHGVGANIFVKLSNLLDFTGIYVKGKAVILSNAFLSARHSLECEDLLLLITKCNCLLLRINLEVTHVQLGAIAI